MRTAVLFLCFLSTALAAPRELRVAMGAKLPPMHFVDGTGRLAGFEVDLVNLYARERGMTAVIVDPAAYHTSSLDMVSSGKADLAVNCIAITEERKGQVDFSEPYYSSGAAVATGTATAKPFDFHRRTFLVLRDSLYARILAGKYLSRVREVANLDEALALLEQERLPKHLPYAIVHDWTALRGAAAARRKVALADFLIATEEYGAAFRRGSDMTQWNAFLQRIRRDGRYQQLVQKWSLGDRLPAVAAVPQPEYRNDAQDWPATPEFEVLPGRRVAEYLPILTSDLRTSRYAGGSSVADRYYGYLMKHFTPDWLPHLEELYFKSVPLSRGKLFSDFVQDRDLTAMLPVLFRSLEREQSWSHATDPVDELLSVLAAKHPEMREEILQRYDRHLEQRTLRVTFTPGCVDENNSSLHIVLLPDGKKARPTAVDISLGRDGDLRMLPGRPGGQTRLMVNGVAGTLQEMTIAGDTSVSIVQVEKGVVADLSLPDDCDYEGMSDDGRTMYLNFKKLRLSLDVRSKKVFRVEIANPLRSTKLRDHAYGKLAGLTWFRSLRSDRGEVHYIGDDLQEKGKVSMYRLDEGTHTVQKRTSLAGELRAPLVMDDKLFVSELGYDSCVPLRVLDTRTGRVLDSGHCGNMVPVGRHELYYCSPDSGWDEHPSEFWIIDTETLKRRKTKESHCPGKTGGFAPHPVPGFFLYFERSLC